MPGDDPEQAQQAPSAQRVQQSDEGQKADDWTAYAQLFYAGLLFLAAIILVGVSHSEDIGKNMDFVKLYSYEKAAFTKSDIIRDITSYTKEAKGSWLNDVTDAQKCLDMTSFWFPTYSFGAAAGQDPRKGTCVFQINLKLGPMEGQLQIGSVTATTTTGCDAGTYTPLWAPPGGVGAVTGAPRIFISGDKVFTFEDTVIGYDFMTFHTGFKTCMTLRKDFATFVHEKTDCRYQHASPMCTCVRAFTVRVESWGAKLNYKPDGKMLLGDVLASGVGRCLDLRRTHDVREPIDRVYARSSALLIFAVALFFNAVLNVLMRFQFFRANAWYSGLVFLVYFAAVLATGLADGDSSGAEFATVLTLTLPAFIVHGSYLVVLSWYFKDQAGQVSEPFLHPVTFDICFSALNLFTLTERGVVQTEYLLVELFKGHAVAAMYIGIVWYHRYGKDRELLTSEFVQQAYVLIYAVGLVASGSGMFTPYPSKKCFEAHWLLPLAFTYAAFSTSGWAQNLKMSSKLNSPAEGVVHNYNAVTGFVVLLVGAVLWGYFLAEHIQLFGIKHFAYPVQGDPQSYAVVKELIMPLSGVAL